MQNNQHKKPKRLVGAVDGMLSPGAVSPKKHHGGGFRAGQHQPERSQLSDFSRAEGFHPAKQQKIVTPAELPKDTPVGLGMHDETAGQQPVDVIDLSLDEGAKKPKRAKWKRFIPRTKKQKILTALGCFILIVGLVIGYLFMNFNQIFQGGGGAAALQEGVDPTQLKGEGDGRINILLLGKGGGNHVAPDLTDTILVASIDPIGKKAALLSIPRDLWVQPEGFGYTKINAVYANAKGSARAGGANEDDVEKAGLAAIDKLVADKMGIPIHYHMMVDFKGFKQAIDTVGGIDIDVKEENLVYETLWDETTGQNYTLDVRQTGVQRFDGTRALFYSRSRYTSARGDFDRAERQRLVIVALKDKVLSAGTLSDPTKLAGLVGAFGNNVRLNMTQSEMLRLYEIGKSIDSANIASLSLVDPPNAFLTTQGINGISVVVPKAGIDDYSAVQNYVRNAMRDGFLASEDARVLILNGTKTDGLATTKSDELKSFGYKVLKVGTAPTQNYTQTVLVDMRGGAKKYTKHYLEQRLKLTAVTSLPDPKIVPGEADFVIILGSDVQ